MTYSFDPLNAEHQFLADALGVDGKFPLGWLEDELVSAREEYLAYAAQLSEREHLFSLPYDIQSPLGILRGVVEICLNRLIDAEVDDELLLKRHEIIWENLALVFSGETAATIH